MPTSILDDIVAAFQQSILRNERRAASEMVRVYVEGWKRVRSQLDRLQGEYDRTIALGEKPSLGWIYQNSRLSDMQELIGKELTRFSKYAVDKVSEEQRRVIANSLTFSRDEMILQLGPQYDVSDFLRVKSLPTSSIEIMVGINQPDSPLKRLLDRINIESSQSASDALIEGMILGYNPRKIAPMIRDALGIQLNRALTISRTEVMRAQRLATEENYKANGDIVQKWRWVAALDGTCPACMAMHGTEHPLSEKMSSHPNCFPAGTLVSGPRQVGGTKRYYTGELVSIRTASGIELSFTPNHPILGRDGWIAGGLLQKGDYVIRSTGLKDAKFTVDINYNDVPTLIEEVVESFDVVLVEMPTAPEDFHGDGIGSQVHVVFTDSLLGNNVDTTLNKPFLKKQFSLRAIALRALFTLRSKAKLFPRMFHSLYSRMRGSSIGLSFFRCHLARLQEISSRIAAYFNAMFQQPITDYISGNSIIFGKRVLGFPGDISGTNITKRIGVVDFSSGTGFLTNNRLPFGFGSKFETTLDDRVFDAVDGDMTIPTEIVEAFPVEIELDKIVEVNRSVFSGHVYNLQTMNEWYIANSIITHNCRCVATPVTLSWEELGKQYGFDFSNVDKSGPTFEEIAKKYNMSPEQAARYQNRQMTGESYFNKLTELEQKKLLGPAKYQAYKDGLFEFEKLAKTTYSPIWGEGKTVASLKDLLGK